MLSNHILVNKLLVNSLTSEHIGTNLYFLLDAGEEGNLVTMNQIYFSILPSWTQSVPDGRRQESGIMFVIICNLAGEQGKRQRQLMRNLWAKNLPQPHNIVFLVTYNNVLSDELLQESELHDDIVGLHVDDHDHYLAHKQALTSLLFSQTYSYQSDYTALLSDDVYVNMEAMTEMAIKHKYSSNRVFGSLYRHYSPARSISAPHFTSLDEWPWTWYPPFLDPHIIIFSQDSLPHILHHSTSSECFVQKAELVDI